MSVSTPHPRAAGDTAVVVGMTGSTGLAVVRALSRGGVRCHAVHYDGATQAMATRLARPVLAPDWRSDPKALVDFLVELAGELGLGGEAAGAGTAAAASLFVCHDAALHAVWSAAARLRKAGLRPAFAARRPLAELLDKRMQMEAAKGVGVEIPWSRWGEAAELAGQADDVPYPAIVKPAFSHLGVRALHAKALRCGGPDELREALGRAAGIDVLVQEYVPGGDDQLYTAGVFVCADGHLAFTGRKLKQHPPGLGIARLAEAVDEPGLVPGSVALLRELGYEGVSQVEYKRDERDGSFRLMEANFRPWTWIGLATACGVNMPLAAHLWALGDEGWRAAGAEQARSGAPDTSATLAGTAASGREERASGASPRRWVWAIPEARYTLRDLRRGVLPSPGQWRGLRAEAFFSRTDPAPLLHALLRRGARTRDGEATPAGPPGAAAGTAPGSTSSPEARSTSPSISPSTSPSAASARRTASRVAKAALLGPSMLAAAVVLWDDWRRAGRRSVSGAPPVVSLPVPGTTLVFAPHPDDETIMCGATLAALRRRGDAVRVVAVTSGAATAVGLPAGPAADVGDLRARELRAACATLGVDDVAVWDFRDRDVSAERGRLAERIAGELAAAHPASVVVPFPYDAHADHVAVALALADALAAPGAPPPPGGPLPSGTAPAPAPRVLCAAVQTPLSPAWPTRLAPVGPTWAVRRAAVAAYASRGPAVFSAATVLARLHPARLLRATDAFVDLVPEAYASLARALEAEGLTRPDVRGGGHALSLASRFVRTRAQRDRVGELLRAAVAP